MSHHRALLSLPPNHRSSEVGYLAAQLSGGKAGMAFLYSVLGAVNTTSGVVDSVVDRLGLAPNLVATGTARPAWDGVSILGDGVNDRLAPAANNAAFDLTTVRALVTIAVFNDATTKITAEITDSLAENRYLAQLVGATNIFAGAIGAAAALDTNVAKGASTRVLIASHNGSTTLSASVLAHTTATRSMTAEGSGTNRLTIFDYFPAGGANSTGPWRATLGLTYEPTAGDRTVLGTWGTTFHGAVLSA